MQLLADLMRYILYDSLKGQRDKVHIFLDIFLGFQPLLTMHLPIDIMLRTFVLPVSSEENGEPVDSNGKLY